MLTEAIIGHLVGDYLLQNDWMAKNKKQRALPCFIHCALWTLSVCLFGHLGWNAAIFLFAMHLLQDGTPLIPFLMDATGQRDFRTGPCAPWSAIVVDNVWHIVTIWLAVKLL